jgi:hypothetical protein
MAASLERRPISDLGGGGGDSDVCSSDGIAPESISGVPAAPVDAADRSAAGISGYAGGTSATGSSGDDAGSSGDAAGVSVAAAAGLSVDAGGGSVNAGGGSVDAGCRFDGVGDVEPGLENIPAMAEK